MMMLMINDVDCLSKDLIQFKEFNYIKSSFLTKDLFGQAFKKYIAATSYSGNK